MSKISFFIDVTTTNAKQGFRHISIGHLPGQVWAISGAGIVCRRIGVTNDNPAGSSWATGIGVSKFSRMFELWSGKLLCCITKKYF